MGKYFNWPPFVAVALDADTGKPLDPRVGMRVRREFYDVRANKNGFPEIVKYRTPEGSRISEKPASDTKKKDNDKDKGKNGNISGNGKDGGEKKDHGDYQKPVDEWTADEDAKLKEMKAANKSWKEIGEELGGRHKSQLQAHWKEINKDGDNADAAKKDNSGDKNKDKSPNNDNKKQQQNNDKNTNKKPEKKGEDQKPASSNKASSKNPSVAHSSRSKTRFTMNEWLTLQEDDLFSFGELQCISELLMRDERQRWLRIAGLFFDKTGRRVHPEDIREKFEEMGNMG